MNKVNYIWNLFVMYVMLGVLRFGGLFNADWKKMYNIKKYQVTHRKNRR